MKTTSIWENTGGKATAFPSATLPVNHGRAGSPVSHDLIAVAGFMFLLAFALG